MRSRFLVFLPLFAAFLAPSAGRAASTSANFGVNVTAAQSIASIGLSSNTFPGGALSGTVVGSIDVTMSPTLPAFSGTLSLAGPNASSFQIAGSTLVTNGVDPPGTYAIRIVATETGVNGSPLAVAETITATSNDLSACNAQTYAYNLVTDFGAVSGGPVATNNAALQAFNVEAQRRTRPTEPGYAGGANGAGNPYPGASKDNCIVLNIPAGTYQYSVNTFAYYIPHLKVVGAGSDLTTGSPTAMQNTNNDGGWGDEIAVNKNDYFGSGNLFNNRGYFIQTANAGATFVTLSGDASNANSFYVGRWVLIASYDQQFAGYPPNFRYYDWAKVTSVNASSGVITFDTPLEFTHLATRPYNGTLIDGPTGTIGPARIIPIDTPASPVGIYHEYDGLHVLANPNWTLGQTGPAGQPFQDCWLVEGLIDGVMNDVHEDEAECFNQIRNFTVKNSQWQGDESDKIVNSLTFANDYVSLGSISHAGELLWHVIGGHLGANSFQGSHAIFEGGAVIDGMLQPCANYKSGIELNWQFQTIDVTVNGVTFKGNGCTNNGPIDAPAIASQAVDGTVVAVASGPNGPGTRLQVRKDLGTYGSPSYNMAVNWGDGASIWRNGNWVTGATVSSITGDANYVYVDVSGTTFTTGDQVWAAKVGKVTVENSVGQNTGYLWSSPNLRYPGAPNSVPNIVWSNNVGN
jgi:hypothetical protein